MIPYFLFALMLILQTIYADHQGIPHNIADDQEDFNL